MRRKRPLFLIVLIVLAVAGGVAAWRTGVFVRKPDAHAQSQLLIPVTAGVAQSQSVPVFVEGLGTVQAFNMVTVRAQVGGQITKIFFKEGQDVKAGDPLVQIDPRPFQATLEQAQATKQKDEAQLQSAQLDLQRAANLLKPGFGTQQTYDQQKATVGQLQAAIKADQAQIDTVQLNVDYALVRSPIDGRTGARLIDIGNLVQASQAAGLVTIAQIKPIFVTFTVPAEHLDDIRRNQAKAPLAVVVFGMDGKTELAHGELTLINNQVDVATGTVQLKAQFDNADEALWPGQFVNARLILSTRQDAVTVTADTVMQGPNGPYVYVLDNTDTAQRRTVTVAATQDGVAVISKGLKAGERVVTEGQYRLTDGAKVKLGGAQQAELGGSAAQ